MKKFLLALLSTFGMVSAASASHGVAFDLQYEPVGADSMRVILKFYRDCAGIQAPTNPILHVYDCTHMSVNPLVYQLQNTINAQIVPVVSAPYLGQTTCSGGGNYPGIEFYQYETVIPIDTSCNTTTLHYEECCRNAAITNLANPSGESFTVEAWFNPQVSNNSVELTTLPVPYLCNQQLFTYNHGAIDAEGDSLVFVNQAPINTNNAPVVYNLPYNVGNPFSTDASGYIQDPMTGQITFSPNGIQIVAVSMQVQEYRNGQMVGSTMRDMQMYIYNCDSNQNVVLRPAIQINGANVIYTPNSNQMGGTFKVARGASFSFIQTADDANTNQIITASSNINRALAGGYANSTNGNPAMIEVFVPALQAQRRATFTTTFEDNANPIPNRTVTGFVVEEDLSLGANVLPNAAFGVKISPNPAQNFIQIELGGLQNGETQIQIIDLTGKTIVSQQISTGNQHISILATQGLASGIYVLQVRNGANFNSQKLIIQK